MKNLDFTLYIKPLIECGVIAVEAVLKPKSATEVTSWDHERICIVRRGQLTCVHSNGKTSLTSGDVLYVSAGGQHQWVTGPDEQVVLLTICYLPAYFESIEPVTKLLGNFADQFGKEDKVEKLHSIETANIRPIVNAILRAKRGQETGAAAELIGLFVQLVAKLVSNRRKLGAPYQARLGSEAFQASVSYLNEHISEQLSVAELAKISMLSTRRYLDVFKSEFGKTPKQYIIEKRLDISKTLILETGNILYSSLDAGFENLSHFYRMFKIHTGMTPKQFMVRYR